LGVTVARRMKIGTPAFLARVGVTDFIGDQPSSREWT